jgi:hypothetical protein
MVDNAICSVCGKKYNYYDTSPSPFCSVYCQLEIDSIDGSYVHRPAEKVRAAKAVRNIGFDKKEVGSKDG